MIELKQNHNNKVKYKHIEIYNANHKLIHINPLAEKQVEHTGAMVRETGDDSEFESLSENVSLVRLNFNRHPFDFLSRPFYFMGKKRNPSFYFSANQYQSGLIDIPLSCKLSDLDLQIPMDYAEFCGVTIFGEGRVDEVKLYPSKEFYVVVKNNSSNTKTVNIIELAKGINTNPMIHILNNDFNIENGNTFGLMRVMTREYKQFHQNVKVLDGDRTLNIFNYFSANQFQDCIIDIEQDFIINPDSAINVDILGKSTVMYHFV